MSVTSGVAFAAPPNILLIICHDLGRWLGCYGVATVNSPHLDRLASEGRRFTAAFTTAPQCSPSRAALTTGRYPHSNGVMGLTHDRFGWDLHPGEQTIAGLLGAAGYDSHLFGLQHVSPDTSRLGFGTVHARGLGPQVSAEVGAFLHQVPAGSGQPFYAEVNLEEPHRPFGQGGVAPDRSRGVTVPPYIPASPAADEEFAAFQGAIAAADTAVGGIIDALAAAGLAETTLVVFTTDHGIAMPRAKCTLYDPGLATALIARWPAGGVPAGTTCAGLVSNIDLLPTLLDATGVAVPPAVQGRSFLPALLGEVDTGRSELFAEKSFHSYYDPMRAVRTETHKYIRNFEAAFAVEVPGDIQAGAIFQADPRRYSGDTHPPVELYDLITDPDEQNNLAGSPALTAVEAELDARLWAWMAATDDPLLAGPISSPSLRASLAARAGPA